MNVNFSAWSIRNPVPSIIMFVVLVMLGVLSFRALPITRFPNIDVPVVAVTVTQSGAAPVELEAQVTKPIEDAIASINGVKHINSTLTDGVSTTAIEFRMEKPTADALQETKDAIAKIRGTLPASIDEPVIQKIDVEGQSIQTYAATAPGMTLEELSWYVDDTVLRELRSIPGVGRVERYGGVNRQINVNLVPAKLQALGVTAATVNAQLAAVNTDQGSGRGDVGGREQAIRTLGGARSLEQLGETKIALPNGTVVRLDDLAKITDGYEEPRTFARFNGNQVVTFSVFRAKGASATAVGDKVTAAIAKLNQAGKGVNYTLVDDTVHYIYGNYTAAMETLIEGAILAVLVVLIFLRDWRATLISAVSLPLSAIPAFWAMSMMGFSLNLVSFLGITLATGILVDDAIVEIENIARHMRMGKSPYRAALEAADEIGLAVIAITFTIVAVFVPVSFMDGIPGQYFRQFGLTVAVAVLFSLLVARLITPMLAAYFMRDHGEVEHEPGLISRAYSQFLYFTNWGPTLHVKRVDTVPVRTLQNAPLRIWHLLQRTGNYVLAFIQWGAGGFGKSNTMREEESQYVTRHPRLMSFITVAAAIGVLMFSVSLIKYLPTGFIPPGDESRFVLSVELPPGSTLKETLAKTEEMAAVVRKNPEVKSVFVLGGSSPTGDIEPRQAAMFINLNTKADGLVPGVLNPIIRGINKILPFTIPTVPTTGRTVPQFQVESEVMPTLAAIADARFWKVNDRGARDVQYDLLSNDPVALASAVTQLEGALRKEPTLRSVAAVGALDRPEIKVTPKLDEAAKLGISSQQISQALRVATIGDFGPLLAKFNAGDRLIPIRVQYPIRARANYDEIRGMKIMNARGQSVPITTVADIAFSTGPAAVTRHDRQRWAKIGADLQPGVQLGDGQKRFEEVAKSLNFPKSVVFSAGGDSEVQGEIFSSFGKAAGLGVVIMLGILVLLLGNFFQPFAIVFALPLSIGGVVGALLATNQAMSMPVIIGMLMLMGIVAKNGIMLIDFAVERVKHGMERVDAIVDAGHKRARPIVMTTLAMGAGMLPSAFGIGEGGEFRAPMATAVIGGLFASTILSLVFVPSFYIVMDDVARLFAWFFGRFAGPQDEAPVVDHSLDDVKAAIAKSEAALEHLDDRIDTVAAEVASKLNPPKKPKLTLAAE
ncbi:MAG: efflux RND transporter permease subunit [Alphaproteobacteria bacterium]|nr:efflux RND transporter permease subunit [Alphaproteobacteria bacterium]